MTILIVNTVKTEKNFEITIEGKNVAGIAPDIQCDVDDTFEMTNILKSTGDA